MFCIFAMIALIFVSLALCCAPSRACLCCILLSVVFIMCAYVSHHQACFLPAFVFLLIRLLRIDVPPSRWLSFVHLCVHHLRADFHLRSGTSYSFIRYPWDCALVCLLIDLLEFCNRSVFYFVDLAGAPGRLDIYSFSDTFIYVSKLLLSPLSFGGFVPSGTFYASAI
jgi:hypothetical protein